MRHNYIKCLKWADSLSTSGEFLILDLGTLEQSINSIVLDIEDAKECLKVLKSKQLQLKLARELNLTHLSPHLSVQCDGKVISINWLKDQPDRLEQGIMKRLGFRWVLNKREFQRKALGVSVDQLKEFIRECEDGYDN